MFENPVTNQNSNNLQDYSNHVVYCQSKGRNIVNWKHNFQILMNSIKDYTRQWKNVKQMTLILS